MMSLLAPILQIANCIEWHVLHPLFVSEVRETEPPRIHPFIPFAEGMQTLRAEVFLSLNLDGIDLSLDDTTSDMPSIKSY